MALALLVIFFAILLVGLALGRVLERGDGLNTEVRLVVTLNKTLGLAYLVAVAIVTTVTKKSDGSQVSQTSVPGTLTDLTIANAQGDFGAVAQNAPDAATNPGAWIYSAGAGDGAQGELHAVANDGTPDAVPVEDSVLVILAAAGGGGGDTETSVGLAFTLTPVGS